MLLDEKYFFKLWNKNEVKQTRKILKKSSSLKIQSVTSNNHVRLVSIWQESKNFLFPYISSTAYSFSVFAF